MLKTPRLLPVVIAATTALLLFKGIGLVTSGGYVLTGTAAAVAAGGASTGTTAAGVNPTMGLPEPETMTDESPTLADTAPVLPLQSEGGAEHAGAADPVAEMAAEPPGVTGLQAACPPADGAPAGSASAAGHGPEPAAPGDQAAEVPDCIPIPLNAHGDAIAMEVNGEGKLAPVESDEGSEATILSRLGERRDDLDAREKELEMRLALVEAAEKRIEERTAALKALEARIDALVEEKKSDEKAQFAGIVAMYETMKPKEAATIFNALDTQMLVRVARAMNPRKMAPILARMEPMKAKALTAGLAREEAEPKMDAAAVEDLANLPQIVGQ
jgi:flagellar motility protein MotE (MotC chaperone)